MDGTFSVNTDSLRTAKTHYDSASNGMNNQESFTACNYLETKLTNLSEKSLDIGLSLSKDAEYFDSTDRSIKSDIQRATSSDH